MEEKEIMVGDIVKFGTSGKYNPGFHTTDVYLGEVESVSDTHVIVKCFNNDKKACVNKQHLINDVDIEDISDWIIENTDLKPCKQALENSSDIFEAIWMACAIYNKSLYERDSDRAMLEWMELNDIIKIPGEDEQRGWIEYWYEVDSPRYMKNIFFKVLLMALKRNK